MSLAALAPARSTDSKGLRMETLAFLASVSQRLALDEPIVSRHAGREMYRHARRYGIELHDEFKERYCAHCCAVLIPTITTRSVSVHRCGGKGRRKHDGGGVCVEYTCSICNGKTIVECGRVDPDVTEAEVTSAMTTETTGTAQGDTSEKLVLKLPKTESQQQQKPQPRAKVKNKKKNKSSLLNASRPASTLSKARDALRSTSRTKPKPKANPFKNSFFDLYVGYHAIGVLMPYLPKMHISFTAYFLLSTAVLVFSVLHAALQFEQFYPIVVHLSQDKISLAIIYNFAFGLLVLVNKLLLRLFVGHLRDLEVEQLIDSGRGFVADTILFLVFYSPTINDREVSTVELIKYVCLAICCKVFHLVAQIRVGHIFELGFTSFSSLLRLAGLIFLCGTVDIIGISTFYELSSAHSSFYTWCLFEAVTMGLTALTTLTKFIIHLVDMRLEHGWTGKTQFIFHVDLWGDVGQMTTYLCFMMVFLSQNPSRLPFYALADILQIARQLVSRLYSLRKYRAITANMEERFPDATQEELETQDTCIICRDKLWEGSKRLPCGHVFHIDCLKSWLVMQQVCPTCRAEIPTHMPPRDAVADAAEARRQGQQEQPQEGTDQAQGTQRHQPSTTGKSEGGANGSKSESSKATPGGEAPKAGSAGTASSSRGSKQDPTILPSAKTVQLPGGGTVTMTHLPVISPHDASAAADDGSPLLAALGVETASQLKEAIKHALNMVEYYEKEKKYWSALLESRGVGSVESTIPAGPAAPEAPEALKKIAKEEGDEGVNDVVDDTDKGGAADQSVSNPDTPDAARHTSTVSPSPTQQQPPVGIDLSVPQLPEQRHSDEGTQTPRLGVESDNLSPAPKDEFELIRKQRQLRYKMTMSKCAVTERSSEEEEEAASDDE
ncbi:E3 ubiquitin-protein ligase hrd1 [Perkinsus olseni]|uniref:RING-type E3 ubiquitin transferase n=3 Tax=Perkinsus olseni TaxID=32597 RepID=A0A7J6SWM2_PEROL|nr:E3 ubiquitin-protein ligase hrd1 [Perkinsus olseni]